jgi:VIT1/CCC1 family predicted Fe2+/Mn2+ transporter
MSQEGPTTFVDQYLQKHYIHRSNWLRAAVLGANDGIISVSSIAMGVVSAGTSRESIIIATLAGLVAGALSMAAGEYVSVSSQTDIENADIEREKKELEEMPEEELMLLAYIYEQRGLKKDTAMQVAKELTEHDVLAAHVRDELGITDISQAKPLQASLVSALAFSLGGLFPLFIVVIGDEKSLTYLIYIFAILSLMFLGYISAKIGGSSPWKSIIRITIWGSLAMGITTIVGKLFDVKV